MVESLTQVDELKFATVLFADIVASSALVEGQEADHSLDILRPMLEAMAASVVHFGGTVNRVTGDGIMALFGAPLADEEHSLAACCAALDMQSQLVMGTTGIKIRVGIHSGEFVVHPLQVAQLTSLDAAGAVVHLAARLQQTAEPGAVWTSGSTIRLAAARLQTEALGTRRLRGFDTPVEVHRLLAADASLTRLDVAGRRDLSPFVGRSNERRCLESRFDRILQGEGAAVVIIGDAGIGKTRLVREFVADIGAAVPVVEARGVRWRASSGFYAFGQIARRVMGPEGSRVVSANAPAIPAAAEALLGGEPDGAWRQLQPSERRLRMMEACVEVVETWLGGRPGILVLDDLHWADSETADAIGLLLDRLPGLPLLLVLVARPDCVPAPLCREGLTRLHLAPLEEGEAGRLARRMLGGGAADDAAVEQILARCGGNPLFIEEAALSPDPAHVPPTVRAVLAARIDRLEPGERRLVDVVAAMDEPVEISLLAACAADEAAVGETLAAVSGLERRGFFRLDGVGLGARVSCRHALYQEVAYRALTERRKRALHATIAMRLERFAGEDAAPYAEVLARHSRLGRLWLVNLAHAQVAGRRALARFANREAVGFIEEGLAALEHLPRDAEGLALAIDLRFQLRDPLFRLGRINQLRERLEEAEVLAEALEDKQRLAQLRIFQSHHAWLIGDYDAALRAIEQTEALARAEVDAALALRALFQRGLWAMGRGLYREAAEAMAAVAADAANPAHGGRFGLDPPLVVVALGYQARALVDAGDVAAARPAAEACVARAAEVARPFSFVLAALAEGYVLHGEGQGAAAVARMREGLALCDKAEADLMRVVALTLLGIAECGAGMWAEAVEHLEAAVALGSGMRFMWHHPVRLAHLALALTQQGRHEAGAGRRAEALAMARAQGVPPSLVEKLAVGG